MKKRSIKIAGHSTSISLEEPFWLSLKQLADDKKLSLNALVDQVDKQRENANLSSALRLFVLDSLQHRIEELTAQPSAPQSNSQ